VARVEGGEVEVATEGGLTVRGTVRGTGVPQVGDIVNVYVRPEFISAKRSAGQSGQAEGRHNVIAGKVDSILFNGANSRALVRDGTGELIEADVVLTGGAQDPKSKDEVALTWPIAQTLIFMD
jgi:spermidine/putrescine transport system ATP-binding protein